MSSQDSKRRATDARLAVDTVHDLLRARRRRYVLYCLYLVSNPMGLSDVTDQIAAWQYGNGVTDLQAERSHIYSNLYHTHVPKLAGHDVVSYSRSTDELELADNAGQLRPYLERAEKDILASTITGRDRWTDTGAREATTPRTETDPNRESTVDDSKPPMTRTEDPSSTSQEVEQSPLLADDDFYRALAARSRRRALSYLLEAEQSTIDELATVLCGWETPHATVVTPEEHDRRRIRLYHTHLPILDDAGLVTYDPDDEAVAIEDLSPPAEALIRRGIAAENR